LLQFLGVLENSPSNTFGSSERAISVLLVPVQTEKQKVRPSGSFFVKTSLPPGGVIVWKFTTVKLDIGFLVTCNDKEVKPYARVQAYVQAACGSFTAPAGAAPDIPSNVAFHLFAPKIHAPCLQSGTSHTPLIPSYSPLAPRLDLAAALICQLKLICCYYL
jgi:hypothetical protein